MRWLAIAGVLCLPAAAAQRWDNRVWPANEHYRGVSQVVTAYAASMTFYVTNWLTLTNYAVSTNERIANIVDAPITNAPMQSVIDYTVVKPVETCQWVEFDWVCTTSLQTVVERHTQTVYRVATNLVFDVKDLRAFDILRAVHARAGEIVVWTNRDPLLHSALTNFSHWAGETTNQSLDNVTNAVLGTFLEELPNFYQRLANDYYRYERGNMMKGWALASFLAQFYFCHVGNKPSLWQLGVGDAWAWPSWRAYAAQQSQSNQVPRYFWDVTVSGATKPSYSSNVMSVIERRGHPRISTNNFGLFMDSTGGWVGGSSYRAVEGEYLPWRAGGAWLWNVSTTSPVPWRAFNEMQTNKLTWNTVQLLVDSMSIYGKVPVVEIYSDCGPLWTPTHFGMGRDTNTYLMASAADRVYVPMDTWLASDVEHTSPGAPYGTMVETGFVIEGYGELPLSDSLVFDRGRAAMVTNLNTVYGGQDFNVAAAGQGGNWYTLVGPWESNRQNYIEIILDSVVRATLQGGTNFIGYSTNTLGVYSGFAKFHNCRVKSARIGRQEEGDTAVLSLSKTSQRVAWSVKLGGVSTNDADGTPYTAPDPDGGVASIIIELDFKDSFKSRASSASAQFQWPQGLWYIKDW